MRPVIRNAILVIVLLVVAVWAVIPPETKLRLGKDLRGGVSLVYSVQIGPDEDARAVLANTIDVLKQRVDPDGILEISMVPQGRDRIEITMPLPNDKVKRLRAQFDAELERLDATSLGDEEFDRVMRLPPDEREAALAAAAGDDADKAALLRAAAEAFDASNAKRAEYQTAKAEGAESSHLLFLSGEAADADLAYEQARDRVMASMLTAREVRRVLELPDRERRLFDEETREAITLPSPRDQALTRLYEEHPDAKASLDRVIAAYEAYAAERKTLDDPSDLVRLLQGAGVLEFRITVNAGEHPQETRLRQELREVGPENVRASDVGWYKIDNIGTWYNNAQQMRALLADPVGYFASQRFVVEPYDGEYYMLAWDVPGSRLSKEDGPWGVARAFQGADELGRPAISFEMDTQGAYLLADLTEDHVGQRMAVLLDDRIYTAPVLNSRIGKSGQISGDFGQEELRYVIRVLGAGSLQAKLSPEPISQSVLGPELGADNLVRGLESGLISLALCAAVLIVYYFWCGTIAFVALMANALLLVAMMALARAPFTLPGIAGVILTFAMAVDANVLIYERMREEFGRGADMRTAVRLGYQKALSAIVDGNITNMIVAIVLYYVGTPEIRGFAVTMSLGVITTLFSQLVITRVIFDIGTEYAGWRRTSMLPIAVPAVQRLFQIDVDWMKRRHLFRAVSAVLVVLSLGVIAYRGSDMLDTEFRGGTAVTVQFKTGPDGEPVRLTRSEAEERLSRAVPEDRPELADLRSADIVVVDPEADGVTSDRFTVKTLVTDANAVRSVVNAAFEDVLDAMPELRFEGSGGEAATAPVYPILSDSLGESIDRPEVRENVRPYLGGAAIVLENLTPAPTLESLRTRLGQTRAKVEFSDTIGRDHEIIVIDGTPEAVRTAAVLVSDPDTSYFINEERWASELRDREWRLVGQALTDSATLLSVQSFDAAVAETFVARAIAALVLSGLLIVIYVWVRFGTVRFAGASLIATVHDCILAVGLIAAAEILYERTPGVATTLGVLPFKVDLTVIAAVLTVLGYSINDKIVIMDRIRENRGKLSYVSKAVINNSINQTFSRTLMTGSTTIFSTMVLYVLGGEAVRVFAYTLFFGIVIGTISSITLGGPLVWSKRAEEAGAAARRPVRRGEVEQPVPA